MQLKTFSAHNKAVNGHDVSRKRFNTHAETGCPRLFHVQNKPRRGWRPRRFAALIPSGCRLTPIHKVMGDHASRGTTPAVACPPHGLSRLGVHDDLFRWAFQVCAIPEYLSRIPFQNTFPEYLSRIPLHVPFHDTCFHVLNF